MIHTDSAQTRYREYFQHRAATDKQLAEADVHHLVRTDALSELPTSPFKRIRVRTVFSAESHSTNFGLGYCVRRALREALKIDIINLPRWISIEDLKSVCQELNLLVHTGPGKIETIIGRRYIVIYSTTDRRAHAIVSDDLRVQEKEGRHIVALVELPD